MFHQSLISENSSRYWIGWPSRHRTLLPTPNSADVAATAPASTDGEALVLKLIVVLLMAVLFKSALVAIRVVGQEQIGFTIDVKI